MTFYNRYLVRVAVKYRSRRNHIHSIKYLENNFMNFVKFMIIIKLV